MVFRPKLIANGAIGESLSLTPALLAEQRVDQREDNCSHE